MRAARLDLLQGMPVFGGIREDALEFLLARSPVVKVAAGDYFFREGDEGHAMFVLEEGKAAVLKNWQGQEHALKYMERGDCFGEMALIDLYPRSASVRAVEDCTAIELGNAVLLELYEKDLEQFTMIQMNIGRELSRRLRKADQHLFHAHVEEKHLSVDDLFELF
ncbi:MAG: Crp/Fnr family transcriptional regulator [Mariprofundaceae bacterium]|nr:Crp/Fnr family transcriptional regulator [Mariprofundaceae bacterium]